MKKTEDSIAKLLGKPLEALDERAKAVAQHVLNRTRMVHQPTKNTDEKTFGEKAADAVANFGGSWTFIFLFSATIIFWITLNSIMLTRTYKAFDPFPYILLNLLLSMLASVQAPLILMSQNRQSQKDRITALHDYEINLKAELEIMLLHEKIDLLRETQLAELLEVQKQQLHLLSELAKK